MPIGFYPVTAKVVGADLVAQLYAVGESMWVGGVSIQCSAVVPAYAIIGPAVASAYAMDNTRSGNIDSSGYYPPREVKAGQPFSILWVGAATGTASMVVQLVPAPPGQQSSGVGYGVR